MPDPSATANPSSSKEKVRAVVPRLIELIDSVVYDDIWERPELSKRDRSMVTIAALIGLRQTDQLRSHLEKALSNGVTAAEISEMITHLAVYAGFPAALSAALVAKPLLEERGLLGEVPAP
ncbi:carboxymuconolactone decarboxylase family protein [Muricoccus pecuniae]|uniref:4-carboxymuconolactone decarboxylase n=1 Tax=Muricoccus pecuniae TaxID=693023 RepID=A0A840YM00_9PROT|nr:carboxymuconolactone decarboxylase family protein [Roseomonas pecuniae]MBB5696242.1 4-carboxymuconolactone decarboxylase [Roseomonas pecuniae]